MIDPRYFPPPFPHTHTIFPSKKKFLTPFRFHFPPPLTHPLRIIKYDLKQSDYRAKPITYSLEQPENIIEKKKGENSPQDIYHIIFQSSLEHEYDRAILVNDDAQW